MSGQNNQNRKLQNLINIGKMADDSVGAAELVDDSVDNAALAATQPKTLCFLYDFDALGGATGSLILTDQAGAGQSLPDNAVITEVVIEGITDLTSGGSATVALGYTGQTDAFLSAAAKTAANWNTNNVTVGTATAAVGKTGSAVAVLATVATADLTAGKFQVWVTYFEGA